jgi:hypothetical protein
MEEILPAYYVPKNYIMDRKTETALPYGSHLENGMVVIIGDQSLRSDLALMEASSMNSMRAYTNNRWCKVENLQILADKIKFTGLYHGGDRIEREYPSVHGWIVKNSTLPNPTKNASESADKIDADNRYLSF